MPKNGYGSNKKQDIYYPIINLKFIYYNMKELECLLMNNEKYCTKSPILLVLILEKICLKEHKNSVLISQIIKPKKI